MMYNSCCNLESLVDYHGSACRALRVMYVVRHSRPRLLHIMCVF